MRANDWPIQFASEPAVLHRMACLGKRQRGTGLRVAA